MGAQPVDTDVVVRPISWPADFDATPAVELRRKRRKPAQRITPGSRERRMFGRTLARWTMDLLPQDSLRTLEWPDADPQADYRNRDWKQLYQGSVLDD